MLTLFLTPEWITVSGNENGFYLCECTDFAYRFPTPEEAYVVAKELLNRFYKKRTESKEWYTVYEKGEIVL